VAVDRPDRVIDVDERYRAGRDRSRQRHPSGQPGQQPSVDRVELPDVPEVKAAQEGAERRARTPVNTRVIAPWRKTSRSSMPSAPVSIPATTHEAFAAAFGQAPLS
jgi:hypothetical protein